MAAIIPASSPIPTRKRARTENDEDSGEWKRHPELYMSDGSVALLANNIVFKVYTGLLSKHSDVFSGMSSLSGHQPSDEEVYDGCPLVRLTDDAEELAYFLEATMGISHIHANQPTSFRIAAAILRLATKYMVPKLRQLAIDHLGRIIPDSIDEIGKKETYTQVFGADVPHPFALVTLFRECQVRPFLPWAFYLACKEGFTKLVSGSPHTGKIIHLSKEDSSNALLGWNWLHDHTLETRRATIMSHAPNCKMGACNDSLRLNWLEVAFYRVKSDAVEPWGLFKMLANCGVTVHTLQDRTPCQMCVASWARTEREHRDQAWEKLPSMFGLGSWVALQRDRHS